MAVEDHPQFDEWLRKLNNLVDTKEAARMGNATQVEVGKAQTEFNNISDVLDIDVFS